MATFVRGLCRRALRSVLFHACRFILRVYSREVIDPAEAEYWRWAASLGWADRTELNGEVYFL